MLVLTCYYVNVFTYFVCSLFIYYISKNDQLFCVYNSTYGYTQLYHTTSSSNPYKKKLYCNHKVHIIISSANSPYFLLIGHTITMKQSKSIHQARLKTPLCCPRIKANQIMYHTTHSTSIRALYNILYPTPWAGQISVYHQK